MNYITDRQIAGIAGETGKNLAAEKKVELIIAPDRAGRPWEGGINGYFLRIARGVPVKVPESVARLISESEQVTLLGEKRVREYRAGSGKKLG